MEIDPDFARFYEAYPRKESKGDALKAWKALRPDKALAETIIKGAQDRAAWCRANGTERRFIKLPATWLRAWCWEDELDDEPKQTDAWGRCLRCTSPGHTAKECTSRWGSYGRLP